MGEAVMTTRRQADGAIVVDVRGTLDAATVDALRRRAFDAGHRRVTLAATVVLGLLTDDSGLAPHDRDHEREQCGSSDADRRDFANRLDAEGHEEIPTTSHRERLAKLFKRPALPGIRFMPTIGLPTACAAMGAVLLALVIWRADIVRLLPQTATFYRMVGLDVNLRGLAFKDIKITNETVEGKPVLVIEGMIVGQTMKPVELPRLRFSVRDEQGAEIYAWNAVLEQQVLKPGERAYFKSRLASPPPEGRNIDVRFFNKRDLAGGHA